MELSNEQKAELAKLQRSFVINRNRGIHAELTKTKVAVFITENDLPYTVEFFAGPE